MNATNYGKFALLSTRSFVRLASGASTQPDSCARAKLYAKPQHLM